MIEREKFVEEFPFRIVHFVGGFYRSLFAICSSTILAGPWIGALGIFDYCAE